MRHKPPLENDWTVACFPLCIAESPGGHCFSSLAVSAATVPPHFPPFPSGVTWEANHVFFKACQFAYVAGKHRWFMSGNLFNWGSCLPEASSGNSPPN